jgi:predicted Zn finger-like uncharacterized protein
MLIVCSTCATAYDIDPAALGAAGRKVRCSRCKATWFATAETADTALAAAALSQPFGSDDLGRAPHAARMMTAHDAEAASPAAIIDAPPLVPPLAEDDSTAEQKQSVAKRPWWLPSRHERKSQLPRWAAPLLLLFAASVAIIGAREEVVRYLPQTAALFTAIGLPTGK